MMTTATTTRTQVGPQAGSGATTRPVEVPAGKITTSEARQLSAELLHGAQHARACLRPGVDQRVTDLARDLESLYSAVIDYAVGGPLPGWLTAVP
jgi:hypothetical protein